MPGGLPGRRQPRTRDPRPSAPLAGSQSAPRQ
jgi:hypothetical protein